MTATSIKTDHYLSAIEAALPYRLTETAFDFAPKYQGKVRDVYDLGDKLALITTDRLTAFDRHLATIPYKGQVLNLVSAWWFEKTKHLIPNHVIAVPDPNVIIVKKCKVFPIEFVVRGYITGSTGTSLWTHYQKGAREYCGLSLPEGLRKNQQLQEPVITPTTKEKEHDRPLSPKEIVEQEWMTQEHWDKASAYALQLFKFGMQVAAQHGLILVDTKYELGLDDRGEIVLVDEIHTPDSSRYWLSSSYAERFANGQEPENIDKEFLRLWFAKQCDPYKDAVLPEAPQELITTLAARYIQLYEMITGQSFDFAEQNQSPHERIKQNLAKYVVAAK